MNLSFVPLSATLSGIKERLKIFMEEINWGISPSKKVMIAPE